jgi:hypothetical protein
VAQQKLPKDKVMFDSFFPLAAKILSRRKLSNILVTRAWISLSLTHHVPFPHSLECSDLSPRRRPWPRAATYAQSPRRPVSLHRTAPHRTRRPCPPPSIGVTPYLATSAPPPDPPPPPLVSVRRRHRSRTLQGHNKNKDKNKRGHE